MPYVPSFLISFVMETVAVEDNGGALLSITDASIADNTDRRVFIDVGTEERACYSGVAGQGNRVIAKDGSIQVVTPPMPIGGPYDVVIRDAGGTLVTTLPAVLDVVARNWQSKAYALRGLLPPWYKTGPRRVDAEDMLE